MIIRIYSITVTMLKELGWINQIIEGRESIQEAGHKKEDREMITKGRNTITNSIENE